jgi:hypothetical protein
LGFAAGDGGPRLYKIHGLDEVGKIRLNCFCCFYKAAFGKLVWSQSSVLRLAWFCFLFYFLRSGLFCV